MTMCFVVTTINPPTESARVLAAAAIAWGGRLIVVADRKTPTNWQCPEAHVLRYEDQAHLPFELAKNLPVNSYSRKMLGYLEAARSGATWIRETDDDNYPQAEFISNRLPSGDARTGGIAGTWVNIYRYFTDRFIWPRGLPLDALHSDSPVTEPIQLDTLQGPFVYQALASGDPDVDAIYRLTSPDLSPVTFRNDPPLVVEPGCWTPFNSQATTWPIALLPLMYLPSTCSFRMTDIWRSFVAQRLMAPLGARVVVTGPTVYQDRNKHDLMRDFRDEIDGYLGYQRFVDTLMNVRILGTPNAILEDLFLLYEELVKKQLIHSSELAVLKSWNKDMELLGFPRESLA